MSEKEEDITIDLSKIAAIFKGKNKKEKPSQKQKEIPAKKPTEDSEPVEKSAEGQDTEISLDLSKITSIFKAKPAEKPKVQATPKVHEVSSQSQEPEAEFSLDFSSIKRSFSKLNKNYLLLFLILIPVILGVYIRMQTADLHRTDTWAQDTVNNYYKNAILSQINQQYPNLPDSKKNELLTTEFNSFLKNQSVLIKQQTDGLSQQFKAEFRNDQGYSYMPDIDSYYWLRFIENMVNHGYMGDTIVDGKSFDNHFMAPDGRTISTGEYFPVYAGYYFYRFIHLFNKSLPPMTAFSYLPVFLFALSAIFIFLIGRRIAGNMGGFFAAMLLAVTPYLVTKTAFGYTDTDMYSVFFPLLITWLYFEAFESTKPLYAAIFSAIAGFFVGIFNLAWGGWLFIFDFLVAATGIYIAYYIIINKTKLSSPKTRAALTELIIAVVIFTVFTMLSISLFNSFDTFKMAFSAPIQFIYIKSVALYSIWPNVYTTVAEQGVVPFSTLVSQMGGTFFFIIAVIGVFLTALKLDKHENFDFKYAILLSIWFLSTLYASTKGMRWILLLVPAFCLGFGSFVGKAIEFLSKFLSKEFSLGKVASTAILAVLFCALLVVPISTANGVTTNLMPDINDAWVRSLTLIKTNSTQDAIINSWWDFGHWFKYWADRRVTFDGTSQNIPQAHWIGRALLTDNEDEAMGILRMLDCGGNKAFETLDPITNDSLESVNLVKEIILLDKEGARSLLIKRGIPADKAEKILSYTHCQPPEDYFITSEDMVSKSGVWAHFGAWNFTRSDMVMRVKPKDAVEGKQLLMSRYSLTPAEADKFYYELKTADPNQWIAGWPSYASGLSPCVITQDVITCQDGMNFNTTSEEAYALTQTGKLYPRSVSYINKEGKFTNKYYNSSIITSNGGQQLGVSIIKKDGSYYSLLMMPELTGSMFNRLFYFNGVGTDHFSIFHADKDFTGFEIYIWKINWPNN